MDRNVEATILQAAPANEVRSLDEMDNRRPTSCFVIYEMIKRVVPLITRTCHLTGTGSVRD